MSTDVLEVLRRDAEGVIRPVIVLAQGSYSDGNPLSFGEWSFKCIML